MEKELDTKIVVNLRDGNFAISGSESFIDKYYQDLKTYVKENMFTAETLDTNQHKEQVACTEMPILSRQQPVQSLIDKYVENGIYYIDENTNQIKILKNVPGNNKASKAKNVAMIMLFAKNGELSNTEIIAQCQEQACFDSGNFSAVFKKKDGWFIRSGSGKNWTLRLTTPGRKAAEELLDGMIDAK